MEEGPRERGGGRVIAVTGASGFVGRHLIRELRGAGHRVRGLTRGVDVLEGIRTVRIRDLFDRPALLEAFSGVDTVVHLAARVHVMEETAERPYEAFRRVNVEGTESVGDAAARSGVSHIVFLSSVKAVAESTAPDEALTGDVSPQPEDPYGRSKLEAEDVLCRRDRPGFVPVTVLRPPLVYGPGVGGNMVRLFRLVARGVPLPLGAVRNRRSMVYVGNLTRAIRGAVESGPLEEDRFFVSDGIDLGTAELVRLIGLSLGRPARVVPVPRALLAGLARVGDLLDDIGGFPWTSAVYERLTASLVVDSEPLWDALGLSPPFTPEEGLGDTAEWFLSDRSGTARAA